MDLVDLFDLFDLLFFFGLFLLLPGRLGRRPTTGGRKENGSAFFPFFFFLSHRYPVPSGGRVFGKRTPGKEGLGYLMCVAFRSFRSFRSFRYRWRRGSGSSLFSLLFFFLFVVLLLPAVRHPFLTSGLLSYFHTLFVVELAIAIGPLIF